MPAWLVPLLIKYGIPLAISILQKTGVVNAAEAFGLKAGTHVIQVVSTIKATPDYTGTGNDPLPNATTNMTTKDGAKVGG